MLPLILLEMSSHIPALHLNASITQGVSNWIQFFLATPVILGAGLPFFQRAVASVVIVIQTCLP